MIRDRTQIGTKCKICGLIIKEKYHWHRHHLFGKQSAKKGKHYKKQIKCICKRCKKIFYVYPATIKKGGGKFCKGCYKQWVKKQANPNWRGGITSKSELLRKSNEYKDWRKAVFERDNYTCQICGDNAGGNLHAHHLWERSKFPEMMFDIRKGITLCKKCHTKIHKKRGNIDDDGSRDRSRNSAVSIFSLDRGENMGDGYIG